MASEDSVAVPAGAADVAATTEQEGDIPQGEEKEADVPQVTHVSAWERVLGEQEQVQRQGCCSSVPPGTNSSKA